MVQKKEPARVRPLDFFYMGVAARLGPARNSGELAGRKTNRSEKNKSASQKKTNRGLVFFELAPDGKRTIKFVCPKPPILTGSPY